MTRRHALMDEGAAYVDGERPGQLIRRSYNTVAGEGFGLCSCGSRSGFLESAAARKKWHREHKVRDEQDEQDFLAAAANDQERQRLDDLDRAEAEAWGDE